MIMLTTEFKDSVLRDIDSPQVKAYVNRAKAKGLMDEHDNWKGKSIEQTLFLVLLMQNAFDYNYTFEEEMPWFGLGWLFNIEHTWKSHFRFGRAMADNNKRLVQMDSEKRELLYNNIYTLFTESS